MWSELTAMLGVYAVNRRDVAGSRGGEIDWDAGARSDKVDLQSSITVWPPTVTRRTTVARLRVAAEWR